MTHSRALAALFALATLTQVAACGDDDSGDTLTSQSSSSVSVDGGTVSTRGGHPGTKLDFASFDQALNAAIAQHNQGASEATRIRGASAVVVDQKLGLVHQQGYGEYASERRYLIASASKVLSVGVLMRLADQGKLDLDAPVSKYLAAWSARTSAPSVAQLVSNSSGLVSLPEISALASMMPPSTELLTRYAPHLCQYTPGGSLSDCGKSIYSDVNPLNNRPADKMFGYGGSAWQLAGAVAEQVSGKSWATLVRETYVEPCGADSLGYTNQFGARADGSSSSSYPRDFNGDVAKLPVTDNPSIEGGAYITARDYGKLLWMHLRGGKCGNAEVLSERAVKRMQENRLKQVYGGTTGNPNLPGYGLGWWISADEKMVADPGLYGTYPFIDRERAYAAIILIELTSDVGAKLALASKPALDAIFDGMSK